jgi:hypothetical protein
VPLTDENRPVTLRASLPSGSIIVHGAETSEILIVVSADGGREPEALQGGMKRIPNTSMGLTVREHGNVVVMGGSWEDASRTLRVTVPRRTSMKLSCVKICVIEVAGVEGELELNNSDGPITAREIRGSVIANSFGGNVTVSFDRIDPDKAMSFVAFDGDVDVTFPPDLRADLRMSSSQGKIYTDFDLTMAPPQIRAETDRSEGTHRVKLEQEVVATTGGGGPELLFKTWYGDIRIRRAGE